MSKRAASQDIDLKNTGSLSVNYPHAISDRCLADTSPCKITLFPQAQPAWSSQKVAKGQHIPNAATMFSSNCSISTSGPAMLGPPVPMLHLLPVTAQAQWLCGHLGLACDFLSVMWLAPLNGLNCPSSPQSSSSSTYWLDYFILDLKAQKPHPPLNWVLWAKIRTWQSRHFLILFLHSEMFIKGMLPSSLLPRRTGSLRGLRPPSADPFSKWLH